MVIKSSMLFPFPHTGLHWKFANATVSCTSRCSCPLFSVLLQSAFSAPLCPQIRSRNPNEIIFGLNDGYYAADFDQKVRPLVCFSGGFFTTMEYPVQISLSIILSSFGFCTETWTRGCFRISRSIRRTACFRLTRVQSGTPTVFSLCSGKIHAVQRWHIHPHSITAGLQSNVMNHFMEYHLLLIFLSIFPIIRLKQLAVIIPILCFCLGLVAQQMVP